LKGYLQVGRIIFANSWSRSRAKGEVEIGKK
jgi:hypothetical protein